MAQPNRRTVLALGTSAAALAMLGAGDGKPLGKKEPTLKVDETIGDLAYVRSVGDVIVEGVGLVVKLDGTGSEPETSQYREKLLGEMRAARVDRPEQVLARPDNSLVLVKARIPVGVSKTDVFDADIELTAGSGTTSLAGGYLLLTKLSQVMTVDGIQREGQTLAIAHGPVVTGTAAAPDNLKVGRVLGGARAKEDQPYLLILKDNRQSVRVAALVQSVIGTRFFALDGIEQKGMATAKDDKHLELRVPKTYHQNQARYFQIVQLLPIADSPELRAQRMERWTKELLDPKMAGVAALRLEGIGRNAVDALKQGLASTDPNVRFFAAESLAYLNDSSGVDILAEAAVARPEFRAFALGALSATDQAAAVTRLRHLMSQPDGELRYGAFNALRSMDEFDVALGKTRVIEDEPVAVPEDAEDDSMAIQIANNRARARRMRDPFALYLVDCDGPPMIHVSSARRSEIVVFGRQQKLLPPLVLGDPSSVLINAGAADDQAQLTRLSAGQGEIADLRATSDLDVGSIVRTAASLGATYPQIVSLLRTAEKQKNLEGPLTSDLVPAANADYEKAQLASEVPNDKSAKKDSAVGRASSDEPKERRGLFSRLRERGQNKKKQEKD